MRMSSNRSLLLLQLASTINLPLIQYEERKPWLTNQE